MEDEEGIEESTDEVIDKLVSELTKRKLVSPFLFLIEAHRPIRGLMLQGLIATQPLLVPFFGASNMRNVLRIMESEERIEALLSALEQQSKGSVEGNMYGS